MRIKTRILAASLPIFISAGFFAALAGQPDSASTVAEASSSVSSASQAITVNAVSTTTYVGDFRVAGTANCAAGQPCFLLNKKGDYNSTGDSLVNFTGAGGASGILPSDIPVTGDWTGDGHAKVGIFRPSTNQWWLDTNNNGVYDAGDLPVFAYPQWARTRLTSRSPGTGWSGQGWCRGLPKRPLGTRYQLR